MSAIRLTISGCRGRMGQRIAALAASDARFELVAGLEHSGHADLGQDWGQLSGLALKGLKVTDDVDRSVEKADCLIDFSAPDATVSYLDAVVKYHRGMVIGTTGLTHQQTEKIDQASKRTLIVFSPNMSIGVNALFACMQKIPKRMIKDYQIKIIETHHKHKKDAPSGTAKRLGEIIQHDLKGELSEDIQSIREGEVVGEHTVIVKNKLEELHLVHKAHSRDAFASGALEAAAFLREKKGVLGGMFTMSDVLGLTS